MKFLRTQLGVLAVLVALAWAPTAAAQVRAWEGEISIPTYLLGEEDPNPPFPLISRHLVYPYTMLDDLTNRREVKSYRAIYLENEYLKAIILPQVGGRLYSLFDKVNNREVFYRNNVVKYGLVGLRGAWISGGIEWNFPDGHTMITVSPVASTVRRNPDGSATVIVGDVDRITRMHWEVALTLRPAQARLEQRVTLFNSTPLTNLYWFWATAAVPASEGMRFVYPMREAYPHIKGEVWSFPIHDGIDWSWDRSVREPTSLFARQSHRNYFGAYYPESDYGVAHVADFRTVQGKKTWTWGVAGDGLIWTKLLTDSDGPYNEIQAGRYETQLNYEFMPPRRAEQFTEYWYPVRGLGDGFLEATDRLALNVRFIAASGTRKPSVEVRVSSVVPLTTAQVRLLVGSRLLREATLLALQPLTGRKLEIAVEDLEAARKSLVVEISSAGKSLLRWRAADPIDGNSEFVPAAGREVPAPKSSDQMTVEELFLLGVEQEKDGKQDIARETFQRLLDRDSNFVPALLKLAAYSYRAADFERAEEFVTRALARNSADPSTEYAAGVVYSGSQRWERAEDALWAAIHYGGPPAPAFALLGEIAIAKRNYDNAASLLREARKYNPEDSLVITDLAVALRLAGRIDQARKTVSDALETMPLLPFAVFEKARLEASPDRSTNAGWKTIVGHDVQNYLEIASWYRRLDDRESADFVLRAALEGRPAQSVSPLVYYFLASNARRAGRGSEAKQFERLAISANPERVFPHRIEEVRVLREAVQEDPDDARARYYLGNFLFAHGRYSDAFGLWDQARNLGFEFPTLYRNLGVYSWRVKRDMKEAGAFYEKAVALTPNDYRLYVDLDEIYAQNGETQRREKLFAGAPAMVLERDTVRVRRALLHVQKREYDQALSILKDHEFKPWEGWEGSEIVRQIYVICNLQVGRASLSRGDYARAEEAFRRATEYPENFGIGKPNEAHDEPALYWWGEALQARGDREGARKVWEEAAKSGKRSSAISQAYQAAALEKLGRAEESRQLMASLVKAAEEKPQASTLFAAGLTDLFSGRTEHATQYFRRAVELDPTFWMAEIELDRGM
ncbi:MAG: DUF5107 domain-containing protein [Terriglobia bacterium]